jgi:hypothetical protein
MVEYTTISIDPEVADEIRDRRDRDGATTTEVVEQLLKAAEES